MSELNYSKITKYNSQVDMFTNIEYLNEQISEIEYMFRSGINLRLFDRYNFEILVYDEIE